MGTRVPVQHYDLRSAAASYIGSSLHDLNAAEGLGGAGDDVDRGGGDVTEDSLDNDEESTAVDCMHETFRNSLPLHDVAVEENQTSLASSGSLRDPYNIVTNEDVSPIESARARFLDIVVDHFISSHVVEVLDMESDYVAQSSQDKLNKRKPREIRHEGDPRHVLPLMYVANMYETLVGEVNLRLSSLNGMREKTIGVALEAAGGLYRKLAKKFPRKGSCMYKRRELATSFETRSRFPELVIQEKKRVRFVVVNGLAIVERPTSMRIDDIEWFKRLTGRSEVAVSPKDYKFYAPRHKYRRVASNSIPNIPALPIMPLRWLKPKIIVLSLNHKIAIRLHQNTTCSQLRTRINFILFSRATNTISTKINTWPTSLTTNIVDPTHTCLKLHTLSTLDLYHLTWLAYNQ
ncbi:PREDICTED: uncharacterized protein At2g02148 isoform X2 [Ipomoea nil]|uniref:uncharacterized protein At2g02148 isoform X2 n=1 Tax=Ipomoea nil TaxID=35883 RepID=UPI0009017CDD|nr:PREDICTED: uncharacterized protein At2g02148 isoform X2 [Ipomoea nil]